jgi:hypothetical protein
MSKTIVKKHLSIPAELWAKIEEQAAEKGKTPEEFAVSLLEQAADTVFIPYYKPGSEDKLIN